MRITWYVDDGYCNSDPQEVEVDDEELAECESVEEKIALIEDCIQGDFEGKVSWYYDQPDFTDK